MLGVQETQVEGTDQGHRWQAGAEGRIGGLLGLSGGTIFQIFPLGNVLCETVTNFTSWGDL